MRSVLKWLWLMIKAAVFRKVTYQLSFIKESTGRWYVDFPNWPLSHDMLEMVAGADESYEWKCGGYGKGSLLVSFKC